VLVKGLLFDCVINGEAPSMKNQRRIVYVGKKPRLIKSQKALDYRDVFFSQCPVYEKLIEEDVVLMVDVWYGSRRPDLACIDYVQDLIQGRVIKNDRQVKASQSVWNLDRENPRVRIRLALAPEQNSEGLSSYAQSEIWESLMSEGSSESKSGQGQNTSEGSAG